jgi:hypothetical protein
MFRVVKVISPMSVGTWILGASGTALGIAGGCEALGIFPRQARGADRGRAAGPAVDDLHGRARRQHGRADLARGAAGAALRLRWPAQRRAPCWSLPRPRRWRCGSGSCSASRTVKGPPAVREAGQGLHRGGRGAHRACGAEAGGRGGRRRLLLAGWLFERLERLAVYRAGTQSAADPKYTVVPPRERAARIGSKATTRPSGS